MQAPRTLIEPVAGLLGGVEVEHRGLVHEALFRRTHWPSLRSIAGMISMGERYVSDK
jgi:hypothetical protein